MNNKNDHDIYIIPPNFIETGTILGGMFKIRNAIEAGILAVAIGVPVFLFVPMGLTARITVAGGLAEKISLSTDDYEVSNISLKFNVVGDRVEYIFYCDVDFYSRVTRSLV